MGVSFSVDAQTGGFPVFAQNAPPVLVQCVRSPFFGTCQRKDVKKKTWLCCWFSNLKRVPSLCRRLAHTHTHTHKHTHSHTRTHTHTHAHLHPHSHSLSHPPTHTHTHPRTHARTHTHTHKWTPKLAVFFLVFVRINNLHNMGLKPRIADRGY